MSSIIHSLAGAGFSRRSRTLFERGPNPEGVTHAFTVVKVRARPIVDLWAGVRHERVELGLAELLKRLGREWHGEALLEDGSWTLSYTLGEIDVGDLDWSAAPRMPWSRRPPLSMRQADEKMRNYATFEAIHAALSDSIEYNERWFRHSALHWLRLMVVSALADQTGRANAVDIVRAEIALRDSTDPSFATTLSTHSFEQITDAARRAVETH